MNRVEFAGETTDDGGITKSAVKLVNNEYIGRGDERTFGIPVEYIEKAEENGYNTLNFSYYVPSDADNSFETNSVYIALWNSERQVMNWDKVLYGTTGVGKWFDISVGIDDLGAYSVSFMCEAKSWYLSDVRFSYVPPVDDPLFNAIGKMSEANAVEKREAVADGNGVKHDAYRLVNNTAAQEGDNRAFFISREYLDAANDTITFKYYIPQDSGYKGNYTLYFAPSQKTAYMWEDLYDVGNEVGVWTEVSFPLKDGCDFAMLLTGYECYIADVTASREAADLRVVYNLNGGTNPEVTGNEHTVDIAEGAPLPELLSVQREGYSFYGWFNGKTKVSSLSELTASATLTARWSKTVALDSLGYKDFDGGRTGVYNDGMFQFDSWGWCRIVFENVSLDGLFTAKVTTSTTISQLVQVGPTADGGASMATGCIAPAIDTIAEQPKTFEVDCSKGGKLAYFVHGGGQSPCIILEILLVY